MSRMARVRHSSRVAAGIMGFAVSVAAAFFLATYVGDGTYEGKTGKGPKVSLPMIVSFPDGLAPGSEKELTLKVNNTQSKAVTFKKSTVTIEAPTAPACKAKEWIQVSARGGTSTANAALSRRVRGEDPLNETYAPGIQPVVPTSSGQMLWLEFIPALAESTDQSACEEVPLVVKGHLE